MVRLLFRSLFRCAFRRVTCPPPDHRRIGGTPRLSSRTLGVGRQRGRSPPSDRGRSSGRRRAAAVIVIVIASQPSTATAMTHLCSSQPGASEAIDRRQRICTGVRSAAGRGAVPWRAAIQNLVSPIARPSSRRRSRSAGGEQRRRSVVAPGVRSVDAHRSSHRRLGVARRGSARVAVRLRCRRVAGSSGAGGGRVPPPTARPSRGPM